MTSNREEIARRSYRAFASGDRETMERILDDDLEFSSPADPYLDRAGYFERCWPHSGGNLSFEFPRVVSIDEQAVLVTYEAVRADGTRFRNTEVLTFSGDRIRRVEVYFGWDVSS